MYSCDYEMMNRLYWNSFAHLWTAFMVILSLGKLIAGDFKSWFKKSLNGVVVISFVVFFLVATGSGYFYTFPVVPLTPAIDKFGNNTSTGLEIDDYDNSTSNGLVVHTYENQVTGDLGSECNVFDGSWVPDETYPLYNASQCPFAEWGFNCLANGRKDKGYLMWRWKPKNCDIPRFDAKEMLELLRGKRVVFVGDSLSRTQWESMICMLMTGVENKKSVYEIKGRKITKRIRHLAVRFSSFNFTIEFYRSVFLVQTGLVPNRAPRRVKSTLKLDSMDDISKEWVDSDILIFNSGHWWIPSKLFDVGGSHQSCKVTKQPMKNVTVRKSSPVSDAIVNIVKNLSIPVTVLHVTPMGAFRSDAHVGTWSDNPSVPDCSHWCLPGVPDTWNELLFSSLMTHQDLS